MSPKSKTLRELANSSFGPGTTQMQYTDASILDSQRRQLEIYREALAPFADLIPASMHGLPKTTKFAPKLTLEPFLAAHRALYGSDVESP